MQIIDKNQARDNEGIRIVIAGQEKIGKTTLSCLAPNPLLIPLEIGYGGVTVDRLPMIKSYQELLSIVTEIGQKLGSSDFPYSSVIFDSGTAIERLIHHRVLSLDPAYGKNTKKAITMETALGGYGSAYSLASDIFSKFLKSCDDLAVYGKLNIIITCHVFPNKIIDPNSGTYDYWDLQMHSPKNQKNYGKRELISQWADIIGFLYEPIYINKTDNLSKGIDSGKGRVLGVSRTPSYVAGNRFAMTDEISIPLKNGWNHLANAVYASSGVNIFSKQET